MFVRSKQPRLKAFLVSGPATRRNHIASLLVSLTETELAGQSEDPVSLMSLQNSSHPDVLILEVGSSRMDAAMLVRRLSQVIRAPIVVISESATLGSSFTLALFEAGAADVLPGLSEPNPTRRDLSERLAVSIRHLSPKLRKQSERRAAETSAAPSKARRGESAKAPSPSQEPDRKTSASAPVRKAADGTGWETMRLHPRQLIVLGASTGGTEAIKEVLMALPEAMPGICIVQHIPAVFSRSFAQRLNSVCALEVREAEHGDVVRPGLVLVAPGGFHMELSWQKTQYVVRLHRGVEEHHQRPAVDVLFRSAAQAGGQHVLGVLLTGMGKDGALGMKAIKEAGGINLAQDDKSCVVFGMPAAAQQLGVVHQVVPLKEMASAIEGRVRVARVGAAA